MIVCEVEPVVLGLDKRKTSFSGGNFTAMRSEVCFVFGV